MSMMLVNCSGCRTALQLPPGAQSIRCALWHQITQIATRFAPAPAPAPYPPPPSSVRPFQHNYPDWTQHEPQNQELLDGAHRCVTQINKMNRGDLSCEELKERQAKAMQDPEFQGILSNPIMRQVLTDFQENPKAAQEHMKNPMVMGKI